MNYQNFDLEIISPQGGQLCARVLESPQGDCPFMSVHWPFGADEENALLAEIYGGLRQRRARSSESGTIQDFGGKLFDAVFAGDIEHLFRSSLDTAARAGKGLRIRLRLPEGSELHTLPWEFLFDTECREFLAVREHTPLIRYVPVAQPIPPITVEGPLRVLVALSSPTDHPRLDTAREWEILCQALEPSITAGRLELRRVPGCCTFDNLRDSLRHFNTHIFHFVGHGLPGALVLEQESGRGLEMEATHLRSASPSGALPRLIVLNACSSAISEDVPFSGLAQGFLKQGVPAVVAMQASITDDAALIFTRYFYRDLIETGAVDASLTEARLRMQGNGHSIEWGTPVLYMRALSGQLFRPAASPAKEKELFEMPLPESVAMPRMQQSLSERKKTMDSPVKETAPPMEPASNPAETKRPRTTRANKTSIQPGPRAGESKLPVRSRRPPVKLEPNLEPFSAEEHTSPIFGAPDMMAPPMSHPAKARWPLMMFRYLTYYLPFSKEDRLREFSSTLELNSPGVSQQAIPVSCHFLAEMYQQVLLNHTSTIEVIISRELTSFTPAFESAQATGAIDPTRKLLVQVVPKSNFVLADPHTDRVEIDPPLANEPKSVYFDVKGAYPGPGEIWIIVRQSQIGIARLVLEPTVIDRAQVAGTYRTKAEASATEAPISASSFDQMLVIEQTIGDKIQYMFELDMPSANVFEQHTSKPFQVKRDEYVKALYREIEERYLSHYSEATRTADVEAFTADLQAYGTTLFEELFPREVQAQLWKHHAKLKSIRVVSTEPFVPWEIVHLKAPGEPLDADAPTLFLGQLGLVRWLHNVNGHPPVQLQIRNGHARYVIPDYPRPDLKLLETVRERAFLEQEFAAIAIEPQPNVVRKLLSQPGAFDLLHFACHGEADQAEINYARLLLEGRMEGRNYVPSWLDASTVEAFAKLRGQDGTQPIVFLNACKAGRAGYKLTGIGGFAQAFLRAGAGAFVGTLWSVGDEPAFFFGKTFYDALLRGQSVPDATTSAREAARQAGDATWLAYVVYAHPHAKLLRSKLFP